MITPKTFLYLIVMLSFFALVGCASDGGNGGYGGGGHRHGGNGGWSFVHYAAHVYLQKD